MAIRRIHIFTILNRLSITMVLVSAVFTGSVFFAYAGAEEHGSDHGSRGHGSSGGGHSEGAGHEGGRHGRGRQGNYDPGREKGHGGGAKAVENTILKSGGRPVWAREGIPEVELGRLNSARVPAHVLQRALEKAQAELLATPGAEIHAPLQNIALYKEAVLRGDLDKAAEYLGFAAEKRMPITSEMVEALNIILGISVSDNEAMAGNADQIRQNILTEHDAGEIDNQH